MKTHWKNLGNYDYLGAYSFEGTNIKEIVLTIKDVKMKSVTAEGGKNETCKVVTFEETAVGNIAIKPMVLNATNCKVIEKLYQTPFIEDWTGKKIIVYPTTTKFARDIVPCLRIKNELPKPFGCSVCGKEISQDFYLASIEKYGIAVCSKECLEESKKNENKGE